LGGELFEGGDGFAAEAVELADGENDGAFEVIVQIAEGERHMAERQRRQTVRISEEDRRNAEHFAMLQRYVITNQ
jgi:hypothetical protein